MRGVFAQEYWSADEVAHAEALWRDGKTASDIASALAACFGTRRSREAVCGYMNRHRDRFPARKASQYDRNLPKKAVRVHPGNLRGKREGRRLDLGFKPPRPLVADAHVYDGASLHLPLDRLSARQCRWPVNDAAPGEAHLFCGHAARLGGRYCDHHASRASGRGTESERAADRVLLRESIHQTGR